VRDHSNDALRVLLVEDESLVRLLLGELIMELGHKVVAEAYKIEDALELANGGDYDLAILDLNLNGKSVYPVADLVKAAGRALIFATGYGPAGLRLEDGGSVVLQKPFDRSNLAEAILAALSSH
jgi:CheY-like chemotaxis protein